MNYNKWLEKYSYYVMYEVIYPYRILFLLCCLIDYSVEYNINVLLVRVHARSSFRDQHLSTVTLVSTLGDCRRAVSAKLRPQPPSLGLLVLLSYSTLSSMILTVTRTPCNIPWRTITIPFCTVPRSRRLISSMASEFPPSSIKQLLGEVAGLLKERKETIAVAETVRCAAKTGPRMCN